MLRIQSSKSPLCRMPWSTTEAPSPPNSYLAISNHLHTVLVKAPLRLQLVSAKVRNHLPPEDPVHRRQTKRAQADHGIEVVGVSARLLPLSRR
ncbi:hypothetical protein XA68_13120 [Ophiocordyceps unilateralis]|uniref:Uncharacterized protein n=1 Tax=Ophiocordyceps unilateralis TaxID=268505 RepID=A0A2A9PMF3_OPHUN|nr:hypothetical protein XA68_13120 [Ophiocordyceps unilateralis]